MIRLTILAVFGLLSFGCAGYGGCGAVPTQQAAPVAAQQSIVPGGLLSQGCKAHGGVSCGNKSLFAGSIEFDPAGIVESVVGQAQRAVPAAPARYAAPAAAQSQACGQWVTETRRVWVGE